MVSRRRRGGGRRPPLVRAPAAAGRFLLRLGRYLLLSLRQAHRDSIFLTASALAYITLISLIPLLASFSFVGARIFNQYDERSLEIFVRVLPYSEAGITQKLSEFLSQAETVRGWGVAVLFITALTVFATVEVTLNRIWKVSRKRPLRVRVASFVLILFFGPILVGATFTSLLLLRQSPAFRALFEQSAFLGALPFLVSLLGLTLLYWRVPYTRVELRNAVAGAGLAALLLELLRQGFAFYVSTFKTMSIVYGSFALALLFALSLEITWAIVLVGSEFAFTAQYFGALSRGLDPRAQLQAAWVGLAALTHVAAERELPRGLSHDTLAAELEVPAAGLGHMLRPLLDDGILVERPGASGGYGIAVDPRHLTVERVFECYDRRASRAVELAGDEVSGRLAELAARLREGRREVLGEKTVAELAGLPPASSPAEAERAPAGLAGDRAGR